MAATKTLTVRTTSRKRRGKMSLQTANKPTMLAMIPPPPIEATQIGVEERTRMGIKMYAFFLKRKYYEGYEQYRFVADYTKSLKHTISN